MKSQQRDVLSLRYSSDILVSILESKERCKFSNLNELVTNHATLNMLLHEFEKNGLIIIEEVSRPHFTRYVDLTMKGKEVAEYLRKAKDLLKGDRDE